jgi:uncharacterized radical SAM superfamily protein
MSIYSLTNDPIKLIQKIREANRVEYDKEIELVLEKIERLLRMISMGITVGDLGPLRALLMQIGALMDTSVFDGLIQRINEMMNNSNKKPLNEKVDDVETIKKEIVHNSIMALSGVLIAATKLDD